MKLTNFCRFYHYLPLFYRGVVLIGLLGVTPKLFAQNQVTQRDLTDPASLVAEAVAGPVAIITLCTNQPDSLELFFVKGWGMRKSGPFSCSPKQRKQLAAGWQIPDSLSFQITYYDRPGAPSNCILRVLSFNKKVPAIRSKFGPAENGPFTLGFPNTQQEKLHAYLQSLGYQTLAPLQASMLNKPDGTQYKYLETIYKGPEWLYAVGIERGNGMPPLSEVDSISQLGGPGYSALNVSGISDTVLAFFTQVLGYELRRDQVWKTGEGSALGLPAGIPFRFSIAYAKGATSGHLLFLDFQKTAPVKSAHPPHIPNAGIGMYSFRTSKFDKLLANAISFGIPIISGPGYLTDPWLGKYRSVVMMAPNQVYIEVIEQK
jgi:hypothetical protein